MCRGCPAVWGPSALLPSISAPGDCSRLHNFPRCHRWSASAVSILTSGCSGLRLLHLHIPRPPHTRKPSLLKLGPPSASRWHLFPAPLFPAACATRLCTLQATVWALHAPTPCGAPAPLPPWVPQAQTVEASEARPGWGSHGSHTNRVGYIFFFFLSRFSAQHGAQCRA